MSENITIQHIVVHASPGSERSDCFLDAICLVWKMKSDVHLIHNEKTYIVEIKNIRDFLYNKIRSKHNE